MSNRIGWNAVNIRAKQIPEHDSIGTFASDPTPPPPDGEETPADQPAQAPSTNHRDQLYRDLKEICLYLLVGIGLLVVIDRMYKIGIERGKSMRGGSFYY